MKKQTDIVLSMGRNITMIIMSLIAGGVLFSVFFSFLKKLKKIEDDFWGTASDEAGRDLERARMEQAKLTVEREKTKEQ